MPHAQSHHEELFNAITHGAGAILGLIALAWLLMQSHVLPTLSLVAGGLYASTVVLLFGASAAYHAMHPGRTKRWLQIADHCAIYLLIAGTYTPFTLVAMDSTAGWSLFAAVWSLAGLGLVLELATDERPEKLAVALCLVMGWLCMFAAVPLFHALSTPALALLVTGGVTYSAGTVFYVRNRPWDHVIWHGFVLGGAGLHGASVLGFVL